mgnify:CR=1 FL=1
MAEKKKKADVYQIVTDQILEQLEKGTVPWRKPWASVGLPANVVSGKAYQGINLLLLGFQSYPTQYWCTFKQAKAMGGNVKKGEKSSIVTFWKFLEKKQDDGTVKKIPMLRYYRVFNIAQCENLKLPKRAQPTTEPAEFSPIEAAEAMVAGWDDCPEIGHGGDRAFYVPSDDRIQMPNREDFTSPDTYYSTLFHEMAHSTGHSSRLDRGLDTKLAPFGSEDYSKEELVAEFASAFLSAQTGIDQSQLQQSAAYIEGWSRKLKDDPKLLIQASSKAKKAATLIAGEPAEAETQKAA